MNRFKTRLASGEKKSCGSPDVVVGHKRNRMKDYDVTTAAYCIFFGFLHLIFHWPFMNRASIFPFDCPLPRSLTNENTSVRIETPHPVQNTSINLQLCKKILGFWLAK